VKKLDLYVLRELFVPFLIGTLSVVLMFQANTLIFQLKTFSISAVPPMGLLQLIMYKTPGFLNMTLPVGMSLAASLAVSRLTRESELTAMRVAGARILRVCLPIMLFGLVVSIGSFFVTERVMPKAESEARRLQTQLAILGAAPEFRSNVVINLRNYVANFGSVSRGRGNLVQLSQVILFERPRVGEVWIYTAETGEYRDGRWTIRDPRVWIVKEDDLTHVQTERKGDDLEINEPITVESFFSTPLSEELTTEELVKAIREGKRTGRDTTSMEVAYHVRFSIPATCIIFSLVAPIFAVWFARSGGFVGVLLSIVLVIVYYNAYIISTEVLGRNGLVSPWLSAWLPNIIYIVFGLIGIRRLE
jgi:lipopolysaccharide export system permease protein